VHSILQFAAEQFPRPQNVEGFSGDQISAFGMAARRGWVERCVRKA